MVLTTFYPKIHRILIDVTRTLDSQPSLTFTLLRWRPLCLCFDTPTPPFPAPSIIVATAEKAICSECH